MPIFFIAFITFTDLFIAIWTSSIDLGNIETESLDPEARANRQRIERLYHQLDWDLLRRHAVDEVRLACVN